MGSFTKRLCISLGYLGQLTVVGKGKMTTAVTETAFHIFGADRPSRFLITCDHATNRVPQFVAGGSLGVAPADMARHIAFDPGAAGLTLALAEMLDAPAILSNFSRLVIDPNRGEDDPTLVRQLYDGTIIPANRYIDAAEVSRRMDTLYRPYHAAYADLAGKRDDRVIVAVHSFTPNLKDHVPRPWQVGILYSHRDERLSRAVLTRLTKRTDIFVGENEPYSGHLPGDAIEKHALIPGRHNTLIELRNDLIANATGQTQWAELLAPVLQAALEDVTEKEKAHG